MSSSLSTILSNAFAIKLTPELIDWIDNEKWKKSYPIEFGEPINPNIISEMIWGGLMLPDTLPILGNGCGDCISIRFNQDGSTREFVKWLHETCEWNPAGQSLSEIVLFESAIRILEENFEIDNIFSDYDYIKWAIEWSGLNDFEKSQLKNLFFSKKPFDLSDLLQRGFPNIPVHKALVKKFLETGLDALSKERGGLNISKKIGVSWDTFKIWLYDPRYIPPQYLSKLSTSFKMSEDTLIHQDWFLAVLHAKNVAQQRSDLAWPFAILGQDAERKGNFDAASDYYLRGIRAFGTTYDFIGFWRELGNLPSEYCAQRLQKIEKYLKTPIKKDEYIQSALDPDFNKVINYWLEKAKKAEQLGRYNKAYEYWYLAGWDHFIFDHVEEILDGLVRTSEKAGLNTLNRLATLHRKSLIR